MPFQAGDPALKRDTLVDKVLYPWTKDASTDDSNARRMAHSYHEYVKGKEAKGEAVGKGKARRCGRTAAVAAVAAAAAARTKQGRRWTVRQRRCVSHALRRRRATEGIRYRYAV